MDVMTLMGTKVPVLPGAAARIVAAATLQPNGCRLSALTPSKGRALVSITVDGKERQVMATRVVAAVKYGRPIEPDEHVHHTCHTPRCVEETHLSPLPAQAHEEHHAEELTQTVCSVHNRPYDRRDSRGWGVCLDCQREATRRWAANNPDKVRGRQYSEETIAKKRASSRARRSTPEYRAKAAARQQLWRARRKAEAEAKEQES